MKDEYKEQIKKYLQKDWRIFPIQLTSKLDEKGEIKKEFRFPIRNGKESWGNFRIEVIREDKIDWEWLQFELDDTPQCGIVTGLPSKITVVDVDSPDISLPPEFKNTFTVKTRRGFQYYFKYNSEVKQTQDEKKEDGTLLGIDLRNDGGFVVCPPTKYKLPNGTVAQYDITKDLPLADFPIEWYHKTFNQKNNTWKEKITAPIIKGSRNNDFCSIIGGLLYTSKEDEWESKVWSIVQSKNMLLNEPLSTNDLRTKFDGIAKKEMEKRKNLKGAGDVFTRIGQAKIFIEKQPIYFSPEGLLWFWNFDRFCYELKDETDLLNGIRKEMNIDTVGSGNRTQILNALKQVGREQAPKIKPKGWIQFNDILVNPKTLEQTKADYKYFLTNPIPHKLGETEETPEIDRLLREWVVKDGVQDESHVKSLFEYIAYSLTDDLFMQRIFAFTGGGSNGKGTFLKVIEHLVGRNNCVSIDIKKLSTNNFAMSSIYKKLVAFAGEVGYSDLASTNVLKKITGEDLIEYEFKGKTSFTEDCITTFFIATNSLPATPDKSTGFYRRWIITDFPNIFNIKADVLSTITEQEYENLCLKCINILKKLYETQKFTNEGNYEQREQKYEERSNPLPTFIEESCEEESGAKIKLQEFGNKFNTWLKSKKLRIADIRQVGKTLRNLGYGIGNRKFEPDTETSHSSVLNLKWKPTNTENTKNTEP
jgi:putative DNA primase/helicase